MPEFVGPEFEIMLHQHEFQFKNATAIRKGCDPIGNTQDTCPAEIAGILL
jgi:hypothetical protein